jgi:hypothetical protein
LQSEQCTIEVSLDFKGTTARVEPQAGQRQVRLTVPLVNVGCPLKDVLPITTGLKKRWHVAMRQLGST